MRFISPLILFFFINNTLISQQVGTSAQSEGLGGITTVIYNEFSAINNPATLAENNSFSIGLNVKSLYLINDLQSGILSTSIPLKNGAIGAYVNTWGIDQFLNFTTGISYGQKINSNISIGVSTYFRNISFGQPYLNFKRLGANIGLTYKPIDNFTIGISFSDFIGANLIESDTQASENLFLGRVGVKYQISEKVFAMLEVEESVRYTTRIRIGVGYKISNSFTVRGGIGLQPQELSFGIAYTPTNLKLNISNMFHSVLGHSPSLSLGYVSNKNQKGE